MISIQILQSHNYYNGNHIVIVMRLLLQIIIIRPQRRPHGDEPGRVLPVLRILAEAPWCHQKGGLLINLRFVIFLDFHYINYALLFGTVVCIFFVQIEGRSWKI